MKVKTPAPVDPLTTELATLLREGPWAIGRDLKTMPYDHDYLRGVWAVHGPAIRKMVPKGRRCWFEARDEFVRLARGEPPA